MYWFFYILNKALSWLYFLTHLWAVTNWKVTLLQSIILIIQVPQYYNKSFVFLHFWYSWQLCFLIAVQKSICDLSICWITGVKYFFKNHNLHIVIHRISLQRSPWNIWKIAHLPLNNTHKLTFQRKIFSQKYNR